MHKVTVVLLALALSSGCAAPSHSAHISPALLKNLQDGSANVMITLKATTTPILNTIQRQSFATRGSRINALATALRTFTSRSQQQVIEFLTSQNVVAKGFWSTNQIFVKAVTLDLVTKLASFDEIESIREDAIRNTEPLPRGTPTPANSLAAQWGVEMVEAPAAWAKGYTGKDVVVAILDTGVRGTHNFVKDNHREVRGWLDSISGRDSPYDNDGHGTHVMGTIAGKDGYGIAPDATWIACGTNFYDSQLIECGQWFICPTHANGTAPDCNAAPHLVSNSWGGAAGSDFFDDTIRAWNAAGIISVWSNGNSGPRCATPTYPKNTNLELIACGATDSDDELAYFSSRGPGTFSGKDTIRPNVAAPGVDIVSASGFSDSGTATLSGTSMAAPHVSGVLALLMSNGTELTYGEITQLIFDSATHTVPASDAACGGIPETEYPNNAVGHGRITALGAIELLEKSRK